MCVCSLEGVRGNIWLLFCSPTLPLIPLSSTSLLRPYIFSHLISRTGNKFHLFQPVYLFIYQPFSAVKNPWDTLHYKASSISSLLRFESLVNRADSVTAVASSGGRRGWGGGICTQRCCTFHRCAHRENKSGECSPLCGN